MMRDCEHSRRHRRGNAADTWRLSNGCFLAQASFGNERFHMARVVDQAESKVPEVTLVFWIIKIAATTLGETGGDTVTMTLNWGYLADTALFLACWSRSSSGRSRQRNSTPRCIGRQSSPPPPWERHWPTCSFA
jgi:repeat uncharacterized protein DUF347